jgi:hypothetical protein
MKVVTKAYDDNTAEITDLATYSRKVYNEIDLIHLKDDVLGLSASGQKINYIQPYSFIMFESDDEMNKYIKDNRITGVLKKYINSMYVALWKINCKIHVDYYVVCTHGPEDIFVAEKGYTQYKNGAKVFGKKQAQETAALMTKKSKTGKHWYAKRCPIE